MKHRLAQSNKTGSVLLISLMVVALLLLIVVTFSVFVRLELRNVINRQQLLQARASARLSANLAIATLQEAAGHDQRITLPAWSDREVPSTIPYENRYFSGARDAREFLTDDTGPTPVLSRNADYGQHQGWMVSNGESFNINTPQFTFTGGYLQIAPTSVLMVGAGSADSTLDVNGNGVPDDFVAVPLENIQDPDGNAREQLGYFVMDEGTKAKLNQFDPFPGSSTPEYSQLMAQQAAVPLVLPNFDLTNDDQREAVGRIHSDPQWELMEEMLSGPQEQTMYQRFFHAVTSHSLGLPVNVKSGGLKKDLTAIAEQMGDQFPDATTSPYTDLLAFHEQRLAEGLRESLFYQSEGDFMTPVQKGLPLRASQITTSTRHKLFPPSSYAGTNVVDPGGPQWRQLLSFLNTGERSYNSSTGVMDATVHSDEGHGTPPVLSRFHLRVQFSLTPQGSDYMIGFHLIPNVALWNPYDVPLRIPETYIFQKISFTNAGGLPLHLRVRHPLWHAAGESHWMPPHHFVPAGSFAGAQSYGSFPLMVKIPETVFEPGESIWFELADHVEMEFSSERGGGFSLFKMADGRSPSNGDGISTLNLDMQNPDHYALMKAGLDAGGSKSFYLLENLTWRSKSEAGAYARRPRSDWNLEPSDFARSHDISRVQPDVPNGQWWQPWRDAGNRWRGPWGGNSRTPTGVPFYPLDFEYSTPEYPGRSFYYAFQTRNEWNTNVDPPVITRTGYQHPYDYSRSRINWNERKIELALQHHLVNYSYRTRTLEIPFDDWDTLKGLDMRSTASWPANPRFKDPNTNVTDNSYDDNLYYDAAEGKYVLPMIFNGMPSRSNRGGIASVVNEVHPAGSGNPRLDVDAYRYNPWLRRDSDDTNWRDDWQRKKVFPVSYNENGIIYSFGSDDPPVPDAIAVDKQGITTAWEVEEIRLGAGHENYRSDNPTDGWPSSRMGRGAMLMGPDPAEFRGLQDQRTRPKVFMMAFNLHPSWPSSLLGDPWAPDFPGPRFTSLPSWDGSSGFIEGVTGDSFGIVFALRAPEHGMTGDDRITFQLPWMNGYNPMATYLAGDPLYQIDEKQFHKIGSGNPVMWVGGVTEDPDLLDPMRWTPDDRSAAIGHSYDAFSERRTVLKRLPRSFEEFTSIGQLMHANPVSLGAASMDGTTPIDRAQTYSPYKDGCRQLGGEYISAYAIGGGTVSDVINPQLPFRFAWSEDPTYPESDLINFVDQQTLVEQGATGTGYNGFDPVGDETREYYFFPVYDYSLYLNNALWDDYMFTGAANGRLRWKNGIVDRDFDLSASRVLVEGAFNINSASPGAWAALLSAHMDMEIPIQGGGTDTDTRYRVPILRTAQPIGTAYTGESGQDYTSQEFYNGFRRLRPGDIWDRSTNTGLAVEIVKAIGERGPFTSLADFVNRDPGADAAKYPNASAAELAEYRRTSPLQMAINRSGINGTTYGIHDASGTSIIRAAEDYSASHRDGTPYHFWRFTDNTEGMAANLGAPGTFMQQDILSRIGGFLQVRSDTFKIRAYGNVFDSTTGTRRAQAWCELVVQRRSEYVDESDTSDVRAGDLTSPINQWMGRRFEVLSFRWLTPEEI